MALTFFRRQEQERTKRVCELNDKSKHSLNLICLAIFLLNVNSDNLKCLQEDERFSAVEYIHRSLCSL
jgi:hypothetical protein